MDDSYVKDLRLLQEAIYESLKAPDQAGSKLLSLQVVFNFIHDHYDKLFDAQNLNTILSTLNYALHGETLACEESVTDIGAFVCELVDQHKKEDELLVALQIFYHILKALKREQKLKCDAKVCHTLIEELFEQHSMTLNANILTCLHLYVEINGGGELIGALWSKITEVDIVNSDLHLEVVAQTLVQLYDDFVLHVTELHANAHFVAIVQKLLSSEERTQRKCAYFLIKKMLEIIVKRARNITDWELDYSGVLEQHWTAYVAIMENLEENQSHLILPSLEKLKDFDRRTGESWLKWMNILYVRLLKNNNTLVNRWVIEYFLEIFTIDGLAAEVLLLLLETLNNTNLYNIENYYLPTKNIAKFLKGDRERFLEIFANVNWKSVPMHFWMEQLSTGVTECIPNELLLKLAGRVRVLPNTTVREKTVEAFLKTFNKNIEELTLRDYLVFVETLYNIGHIYADYLMFSSKLNKYAGNKDQVANFTRRFYNIITCKHANIDLKYFNESTNKQHGWLRFYIVFDATPTPEIKEFCKKRYGIDMALFNDDTANLTELKEYMRKKLVGHESEDSFVRLKCEEFYVERCLKKFSSLLQPYMKFEYIEKLLDVCTLRTLERMSFLLSQHDDKIDDRVLRYFVQQMKFYKQRNLYSVVHGLVTYLKKKPQPVLLKELLHQTIDINAENEGIYRALLYSRTLQDTPWYMNTLCTRDAKTGDARIEEAYISKNFKKTSIFLAIRWDYMTELPVAAVEPLLAKLHNMQLEMNSQVKRYFENSKEHRLRLRIAYSIAVLLIKNPTLKYPGNKDLWHLLLSHSNQPNVALLYEYLLARHIKTFEEVLRKLNELEVISYTAGGIISLICVSHGFFLLNKSTITVDQLERLIYSIMPYTMGANFQVRLYAQLAIYNILTLTKNTDVKITQHDRFTKSMSDAIGPQVTELLNDVRLQMIWLKSDGPMTTDIILYISNTPYDEYYKMFDTEPYERAKSLFTQKMLNVAKQKQQQPTMLEETDDENKHFTPFSSKNIQRKMNPLYGVLAPNTLAKYKNKRFCEIIIVASLIDKLPNLGGIARTCNVFGIRNLVVNSLSDVEKSDFKSVSMTAEQELNIQEVKSAALVEFLMEKHRDGFQIVGAEQTTNSISLEDYRFPRRCVILLGQEKEGIPSNLLGFLNHTVEIPQFGTVRSLNVHVTAALFMWGYCKQHIIIKD